MEITTILIFLFVSRVFWLEQTNRQQQEALRRHRLELNALQERYWRLYQQNFRLTVENRNLKQGFYHPGAG